jgi:Protein of unknown function (DUF2510)
VGTYYGHGSWLFLLVFFAFFAMRAFSSRRRRGGSTSAFGPTSSSHFTTTQPSDLDGEPAATVPFTGIAPGWLIDPSGRHEKRYWSGAEWTEHVTDGGVPGIDPPPGSSEKAS